jgi:nicotinamidase-related amidase
MMDLAVTVVSDCCAARSETEHEEALENMREMAKARVISAKSVRFRK